MLSLFATIPPGSPYLDSPPAAFGLFAVLAFALVSVLVAAAILLREKVRASKIAPNLVEERDAQAAEVRRLAEREAILEARVEEITNPSPHILTGAAILVASVDGRFLERYRVYRVTDEEGQVTLGLEREHNAPL